MSSIRLNRFPVGENELTLDNWLPRKPDAPRILVVEDDPDICRNLGDILTDLGYEVDTAQDGPTAVELVRQRAYDVALLDLKMPGMDGLTLYHEIKKRAPARSHCW